MPVMSIGGYKYFITLLDDFTNNQEVRPLQRKSEALNALKNFITFHQQRLGTKLRAIRADGAGENTSNEMLKWCNKQGIELELTNPYSPQSNGKAERLNRTDVDMVRTMLNSVGFPHKWWNEALQAAVHIRNRCPSAGTKDKTPHELWIGKRPAVMHLRP